MPGERFAQTRMRIMRADEAQNWTADDLQYAINEVFARHGWRFENNRDRGRVSAISAGIVPRADRSNRQIEESLSDVEVQNVIDAAFGHRGPQ